jgi:hypothetical protein
LQKGQFASATRCGLFALEYPLGVTQFSQLQF